MEDKTRKYVSSRFSDFYRKNPPELPPQKDKRELGYLPWKGDFMKRHISTETVGDFRMFLSDSKPRHLYITGAIFESPELPTMDQKGWEGANLIFDIDDKDIPEVNKDDNYGERLEKAKQEMFKLLDFIKHDFGFEDYTINFSGNQGFHLRVHDDKVLELNSDQRIEIANYIRLPNDINLDKLFVSATNFDYPPKVKRFHPSGGWAKRLYYKTKDYFKELEEMDEEERIRELESYEGIGNTKSQQLSTKIDHINGLLKWGAIDTSSGVETILEKLLEEIVEESRIYIDEPVTTDVNRLLRVQNSLHGGSGLLAQKVDENNLENFQPPTDSIPEMFKKRKTKIKVDEEKKIYRNGQYYELEKGVNKVPEFIAISLICEEEAEKH